MAKPTPTTKPTTKPTITEGRGQRKGRAGMPGDAQRRLESPGHSGVHPASAGWPEDDMAIRRQGEWGQGGRGLEGYDDAGESEIVPPPGSSGGGGSTPSATDLGAVEGGGPKRVSEAPPTVAGAPGPADESNAELGVRPKPVAGRPGPADEANAALGVPPGEGSSEAQAD